MDFEFQDAEGNVQQNEGGSRIGKSPILPADSNTSSKPDSESDTEMEQFHSNLSALVAAREAKSRNPNPVPAVASDGSDGESNATSATAQIIESDSDEGQPDPGKPLTENAQIHASGNLKLQKSVPTHDTSIATAITKAHLLHHLAKGTQHDRSVQAVIKSCNFLPGFCHCKKRSKSTKSKAVLVSW